MINEEEVADFKWMSLEALKEDMEDAPEKYTFWFQKILKEFDFKKLL